MKNMQELTLKQFVDLIELNFNSGVKDAFAGLGLGGIGKSQSIYDLTKKLGIGYVDIRLLQYNITDFKGIPFKSDIEGFTKFLISDLFPRKVTANDDPNDPRFQERGILVLDEITSCTTSLRTVMYQLVNERCLGEYRLPDGWLIVMLGNGINDGGDFNGIEGNLLNRCFSYRVISHQADFAEYLQNKYVGLVGSLVSSYLDHKPTNLHTFNSEAVDEDDLVFASSRSWERVCKLLVQDELLRTELKLSDSTKLLISGAIGTRVAYDFFTYMDKYSKLPKTQDILEGKYDLENAKNEYYEKTKGTSDVNEKIDIIKGIKGSKAKSYALALETARDKALGIVVVNSLVDNLINDYTLIAKDSFDYFNKNHTLNDELDVFLDKFINACNFMSDFMKGDLLRLFILLVTEESKLRLRVPDFDHSTYMSIVIFHKKSQDPKINRGNIKENSQDYLIAEGRLDASNMELA